MSADRQAQAPPTLPSDACWNKIGVYGTSACLELPRFIHCRNCPVYSKFGIQLLDRPLPAGYRQEWTDHFAAAKRLSEPGKTSAVVFRIGNEWLALPTQAFQEIAERRPIHSLPHRRHGALLGLANIRGELLLCISLGQVLGLEKTPAAQVLRRNYHRLLVTSWEGNRFAFPVDEVQGPHRFHPHDLKPPPATLAKAASSYTQGILHWEQLAVGCLDAPLLFATLNQAIA